MEFIGFIGVFLEMLAAAILTFLGNTDRALEAAVIGLVFIGVSVIAQAGGGR